MFLVALPFEYYIEITLEPIFVMFIPQMCYSTGAFHVL